MKLSSSQGRKLVYLVGIMVLLVPIVGLSYPASGPSGQSAAGEGGYLSRLRAREGLGESTLGDVDPTSLTMNLVLLGLRGVAANVLWTQALDMQKVHNWSGLRTAVNSIILLQPHFVQVWSFQGWNLSYNVSTEFDAVEDRYHWVTEGIKFLMEGTQRNKTVPDLHYQVGVQLGKKIGGSDERDFFRKMFKDDDELNPRKEDNFLKAKQWYGKSLEVADAGGRGPIRGHPVVFRSSPGLALMQYATALEREGTFGEVARTAWENAYDYWTGDFGRWEFPAPEGTGPVRLESTPQERSRLSDQQRYWSARFQELVNYSYWRMRAETEQTASLLSARNAIYEGDQAYLRGDLRSARTSYETGMKLWDQVLEEKPQMLDSQDTVEEGADILFRYREILTQFGEADRVEGMEEGKHLPDDFPMSVVWERFQEMQRHFQLSMEAAEEARRLRRAGRPGGSLQRSQQVPTRGQ